MTAFTMLGLSGEAYNRGVVVFAFVGSSSALLVPFIFYYLGTRCWWLGKRHGYVTQVQLIRDRYRSGALGTLLFVVIVLLMLPYILIGVKGGGRCVERHYRRRGRRHAAVGRQLGRLRRDVSLCHLRRNAQHVVGEYVSDGGLHDGLGGGVFCHPARIRRRGKRPCSRFGNGTGNWWCSTRTRPRGCACFRTFSSPCVRARFPIFTPIGCRRKSLVLSARCWFSTRSVSWS